MPNTSKTRRRIVRWCGSCLKNTTWTETVTTTNGAVTSTEVVCTDCGEDKKL